MKRKNLKIVKFLVELESVKELKNFRRKDARCWKNLVKQFSLQKKFIKLKKKKKSKIVFLTKKKQRSKGEKSLITR